MFGAKARVNRFDHWLDKYPFDSSEEGMILMYGHSLFTRCGPQGGEWDDPNIEEHVLMKDGSRAIVNHGFGGSKDSAVERLSRFIAEVSRKKNRIYKGKFYPEVRATFERKMSNTCNAVRYFNACKPGTTTERATCNTQSTFLYGN